MRSGRPFVRTMRMLSLTAPRFGVLPASARADARTRSIEGASCGARWRARRQVRAGGPSSKRRLTSGATSRSSSRTRGSRRPPARWEAVSTRRSSCGVLGTRRSARRSGTSVTPRTSPASIPTPLPPAPGLAGESPRSHPKAQERVKNVGEPVRPRGEASRGAPGHASGGSGHRPGEASGRPVVRAFVCLDALMS